MVVYKIIPTANSVVRGSNYKVKNRNLRYSAVNTMTPGAPKFENLKDHGG
jgi:hypothetical protein